MMKTRQILRWTLGVLLLIFACVTVLFQLPSFQTFVARKAVDSLQDKINGKIEIGSVHFKFINTIVIKNIAITDLNPPAEDAYDTLFRAGAISVRFSLFGLLAYDCVSLKSVKIKDARMNLVIDGNKEFPNNISRIFRLPPKAEPQDMTTKPIIHIDKIQIENFGYGMRNYANESKIQNPWNADWTDLDVTKINLLATDFNIRNAHFTGNLHKLSCEEKSGWKIMHLSGKASVGMGEVIVKNALYKDGFGSEVDFDYKMLARIFEYQDFLNRVKLDGVFRKSRVSLNTLARVVPIMYEDSTIFATLTGHAYGPVADLHGDTLKLGFENNCVQATVNGGIYGIPDQMKMGVDSHISDIRFSTEDLTKILKAIIQKKNIDLTGIGKNAIYTADVRTSGLINNLRAKLSLNQVCDKEDCGQLDLEVKLDNVMANQAKPMSIKGQILTEMLDVSAIVGKPLANDLTLSSHLDVKLPTKDTKLQVLLDTVSIDNVEYNSYTYRDIRGFASLNGKDLDAKLHCRDSALLADVRIWTDKDEYRADIDLRTADLHRMNFDKKPLSIVHANISTTLDKNLNKPQGAGLISGIRLYNDTGVHRVDDINVFADMEGDQYNITVESGLTDGGFHGTKDSFNAYMTLGETMELMNFILPGLYAEKGTTLSARRDSTGCIYGTVESGRLAFKKNYAKNIVANFSGPIDSLEARITSDDIAVSDLHFTNSTIDASFVKSLLSVNYEYYTTERGHTFDGKLNGSVLFNPDNSLEIKILPSYFCTDEDKWEFQEAAIMKKGADIIIDDFMLSCKDQYVKLSGGIHENQVDTLKASIKDFDLNNLNILTRDKNFDFHGRLSAEGKIISPRVTGMDLLADLPRIEVQLDARDVKLKGHDYGNLKVLSVYEHDMKRFRIDLSDEIESRNALTGKVYYVPSNKDMTIIAKTDRFPFGFVGAFTEGVFSELDGYATADVNITRTDNVLNLFCEKGRIDQGLLGIEFTHVPYYVDGTFNMDNAGVHFIDMVVHDKLKGTGKATGGIKWDRLKDISMDVHLNVNEIEALNIPSSKSGTPFYGNVIASGNVSLTGPFSNILLAADAKTTGPSKMHFVVSDDLDATKGEILKFTDPYIKDIDPYVKMIAEQNAAVKAQSGMSLKIRAEADQNFEAHLDMTGTGFAAGAIGRGTGLVNLDIDTRTQNFSILGDYKLEEGIFDFNASDIVHRQFTIKDGSVVKFCGTIPQTELNLEAIYETKASIAPLIADTTSVTNRRLVQCGINLKNKLTNPNISFNIKIPDLDPSVQTSVESALNTEAKVQRQFLSILVSNNFLPDEQSGIVNNASILYTNVSALMATQINNIFTKLDIPLDLGLNYQPSEKGGASMFDVALSTQLWNNRVIIGGSLGNRQSTNSTNGTIFGDLDIEYKVTKNGAFRIKAFSHAADQYSNYLDQSQRNGIGATWQQEFDNFCTWCKYLFLKKDEKIKFQEEEAKRSKQTKKLTLDE